MKPSTTSFPMAKHFCSSGWSRDTAPRPGKIGSPSIRLGSGMGSFRISAGGGGGSSGALWGIWIFGTHIRPPLPQELDLEPIRFGLLPSYHGCSSRRGARGSNSSDLPNPVLGGACSTSIGAGFSPCSLRNFRRLGSTNPELKAIPAGSPSCRDLIVPMNPALGSSQEYPRWYLSCCSWRSICRSLAASILGP